MNELFDYGGIKPEPSAEVAIYDLDQDLITTDWRKRASDHFRESKWDGQGQGFNSAIGALSLAVSSERASRSQKAEIEHWEGRLELEHDGPDD